MVKVQKSAKKLLRKRFRQVYNSEVNKPQMKKPKNLCDLDERKMQLIKMYDKAHSIFRERPGCDNYNIFMDILKVAPLVDLDSTQVSKNRKPAPNESVDAFDTSFIPIVLD